MKTVNLDMSDNSIYEVAVFSNIGGRKEQQDCLFSVIKETEALVAVCDGMGGRKGGRLASQTAVNWLGERFSCRKEEMGEFLANILEELDEQVFFLKDENRRKMGAGTTIVAVALEYMNMYWLSVGDSRLYVKRGNEMVQVTRDHNYFLELQQWLNEGRITENQFEAEKAKGEALISYIGMGGIEVFDLGKIPLGLMSGDTILLTTDGLWKAIPIEKISAAIQPEIDINESISLLATELVRVPVEYRDNATFALVRVK